MLKIIVPPTELYDEIKNEFIITKEYELQLEHSLVSISKWESTWKKPFLATKNKTKEEALDYIRCMTLTQNVDPSVYKNITSKQIQEISEYIDDPMSATTIAPYTGKINRDVVTSEIIYYWMIAFNIPLECQRWHLNRLMTLIQVCNVKNQPAKKMSQKELVARNKALNEQRKAQYKTKG